MRWTRAALAAVLAPARPVHAGCEVVVQARNSGRRSEVADVTVEPNGTVVIHVGEAIIEGMMDRG